MTIPRPESKPLRSRDRQVIRTDDLDDETLDAILSSEPGARSKVAGERSADTGPDDVLPGAATISDSNVPASEWIDPDDAPELTDAWFDATEFRVNRKIIRPTRGFLAREGVVLGFRLTKSD